MTDEQTLLELASRATKPIIDRWLAQQYANEMKDDVLRVFVQPAPPSEDVSIEILEDLESAAIKVMRARRKAGMRAMWTSRYLCARMNYESGMAALGVIRILIHGTAGLSASELERMIT